MTTDSDICHCKCHDPTGGFVMMHCLPCCKVCRYCHQRVKVAGHAVHEDRCVMVLAGASNSVGAFLPGEGE